MENTRYIYINGINNSADYARRNAEHISKLGNDLKVYYVYNPHKGMLNDIKSAFLSYFGFASSVEMEYTNLCDAFLNENPNMKIYTFPHSDANLKIDNQLKSYDREKARHIHVRSYNPAKFIDQGLCGSVKTVCNIADPIPLFDPLGFVRNFGTVSFTASDEFTLFDHSFNSKANESFIERHLKESYAH